MQKIVKRYLLKQPKLLMTNLFQGIGGWNLPVVRFPNPIWSEICWNWPDCLLSPPRHISPSPILLHLFHLDTDNCHTPAHSSRWHMALACVSRYHTPGYTCHKCASWHAFDTHKQQPSTFLHLVGPLSWLHLPINPSQVPAFSHPQTFLLVAIRIIKIFVCFVKFLV